MHLATANHKECGSHNGYLERGQIVTKLKKMILEISLYKECGSYNGCLEKGVATFMDKKQASIILGDELLELSMLLEKAKTASEVSMGYCLDEFFGNLEVLQEKVKEASCLNNIIIDYLNQACKLLEYI